MKKFFFALAGIVLLAAGCTKESSKEQETDTNYFVKFRLGSEIKEYRNVVLAIRSTAGGVFSVSVQGQVALTDNKEGILVAVSDSIPIAAKTYVETDLSDSPAMLYRDTTGKEYSTLFATAATGTTVTISNINSTSVRGNFAGKVTDLDGNEINVTEGSFYAKFQ